MQLKHTLRKISGIGLAFSLFTILFLTGCLGGGGGASGSSTSGGGVTLTSISITPTTAAIFQGAAQQLTATGTYSDGSTANITSVVTWTSTSATVATINAAGLATALAGGTTNITAGLSGVTSNSAVLTVRVKMGGAIQGIPLGLTAAVTTFAGSGTFGSADGIGTAASFNSPNGIATDGTNLYVVDTNYSRIRQIVIATDAITTLAGSVGIGSVDGPGWAASFNLPQAITTDGTNLYVADTNNFKIRKIVIATGLVTTFAGSGAPGATDGFSTTASFNTPFGITTDGTNLYVADAGNNKIRQIVIATGTVTTLAGSGAIGSTDGTGTAASFNFPQAITTDGTNLYVAESGNNKIRKIVIATGSVTTLAGSGAIGSADGTGTAASFNRPLGITTDGINLYVTDMYNNKIRKIVIATSAVTTLAGSGAIGAADGTGTAAAFNFPRNITTDGTSLYVADSGNNKIRKVQ